VDVVVTIVEGEQDRAAAHSGGHEMWDLVNTLSACITVASAALVDAGIDCIDSVSAGAAALTASPVSGNPEVVLEPSDLSQVLAACCVAYLPSREEVAALWVKGHIPPSDSVNSTRLIAAAIRSAKATGLTLSESLRELASTNNET